MKRYQLQATNTPGFGLARYLVRVWAVAVTVATAFLLPSVSAASAAAVR
jgi:hypothetical protein